MYLSTVGKTIRNLVVLVIAELVVVAVLLSILFYLVITPISIVGKLAGNKFLDQAIDKHSESYWHVRTEEANAPERLEKQY